MRQRIHQSFRNPSNGGRSSHLAPRPFTAQTQSDSRRPPTQEEMENETFDLNKSEALNLQLKKERGTITSAEQENLDILQAKMNDFWTQRLERTSRTGHNIADIPGPSPFVHKTDAPCPDTIQRVKNDEATPEFFPLKKISLRDKDNFYFYHGTFADNLKGIGKSGLDPKEGGSKKGASRYEGGGSSDAQGLTKYTTDPNIAMIYAKAPTQMKPPTVGIFLEARVARKTVLDLFNDATGKGEQTPFWRRERGGENSRIIKGISPEDAALNQAGEPGEKDPIRAVETNTPVKAEDLKLVGVYLPGNTEVDEGELERTLNPKVEAVAIDMDTMKSTNLYADPWLNK